MSEYGSAPSNKKWTSLLTAFDIHSLIFREQCRSAQRDPHERAQQRPAEQIADLPSFRIVEQTVDVPCRGGTFCVAASTLEAAESPNHCCFCTFHRKKEVRQVGGSRVRACCRTPARPLWRTIQTSSTPSRSRGCRPTPRTSLGTGGVEAVRRRRSWERARGHSRDDRLLW